MSIPKTSRLCNTNPVTRDDANSTIRELNARIDSIYDQTKTADVSLAAVGSTPNADGASISDDQVLTLEPADGTHPGVLTAGAQTIGGAKTFTGAVSASNISGTNTGDVTLTAVGSSPSANAASLSGQALTLQPADGTHPGVVTALAQTIAGVKTFSSAPLLSSGFVSTADSVLGTDAPSNITLSTGYTLKGPSLLSGGTADQAGADISISAGSGKGAGTPPVIRLKAPNIGSTGTALNSPVDIVDIGYNATLGGPGMACHGWLLMDGAQTSNFAVIYGSGSSGLEVLSSANTLLLKCPGSNSQAISFQDTSNNILANFDTTPGALTFNSSGVGWKIPVGSYNTISSSITVDPTVNIEVQDHLQVSTHVDLQGRLVDASIPRSVSQNNPGLVAGAGRLLGDTSGQPAAAGDVGEVMTISRLRSNATALTSTIVLNVGTTTSITLTAGDWNVKGIVGFTPDTATSITVMQAGISKTSATLPGSDTTGVPTSGETKILWTEPATVPGSGSAGVPDTLQIPDFQVLVPFGTTMQIFLVASANFTVSFLNVFGWMQARRMR